MGFLTRTPLVHWACSQPGHGPLRYVDTHAMAPLNRPVGRDFNLLEHLRRSNRTTVAPGASLYAEVFSQAWLPDATEWYPTHLTGTGRDEFYLMPLTRAVTTARPTSSVEYASATWPRIRAGMAGPRAAGRGVIMSNMTLAPTVLPASTSAKFSILNSVESTIHHDSIGTRVRHPSVSGQGCGALLVRRCGLPVSPGTRSSAS